MIRADDYVVSKEVNTELLNKNGFRYGTFKCFIYKDVIQFVVHINLENKEWEYQVYDVDHASLYAPYYNREFGVSDVVKNIDNKIRKIMKEFEKQNIIIKELEGIDVNE